MEPGWRSINESSGIRVGKVILEQGFVLPVIGEVPVQAIQALPYVLTVVLLAGFIGRATAPSAHISRR